MAKQKLPPASEITDIMKFCFSDAFREDPYLFTLWAFPWGDKNYRLKNQAGPREWQKRELIKIGEHMKKQKERVAQGLSPEVYKLAVSSGRGVGKSALVSWLVIWMISCHFGSTVIVSANTDHQISDITFGEIGKWLTLSITNFFFEQTQKRIAPADWYVKQLKEEMKIDTTYFFAEGKLWDEDSPSAFAGAHSDIGMMVVFDEASGIPTTIWDVTLGFFSDKVVPRFWFAFSNPRNGSGGFYDAFYQPDTPWQTRQINSLDVPEIDHGPANEIINKYGADSDRAAVEVYGKFPKTGERQFISRGVVQDAVHRQIDGMDASAPLVMGVDVARFGGDSTVLAFRAGRDARSIPPIILNGVDNMGVVSRLTQAIHQFNPAGVFIDAGAGAGVIDRMKELGYRCHEVAFGSASGEAQWFDHRTELWAKMRDWLAGGMIPNDHDLIAGLTAPEKELIGRESKEKLESKEKMKKRGIDSPDFADALALTFHLKVANRDLQTSRKRKPNRYGAWSRGILD